MLKVPSESLIQIDFGNIGDLLKVRIEIDGNGDSPDYFLSYVLMRDLDTDECFVVICGKWLRWQSLKLGAQPFRELLAFHMGIKPLPCNILSKLFLFFFKKFLFFYSNCL